MIDRREFMKAGGTGAAGLAFARWAAAGAGAQGRPSALPPGPELRFRQIHLDFHTSQHVSGIGADFDPEAFADTLARAHVNSVTAFGRCHHGYIYYDTKAFPERRHPHLVKSLLPEQIAACHRRDIRVPIYVTIQWDQFTADQQPGWRQVTETGALQGTPPYEPGFYRRLCLNSPYVDFLKAHLRELFELVPVDGLFLDIVASQDCSCPRCLRDMAARGVGPADAKARQAFGRDVTFGFQRDLTAFIRQLDRQCTIFYNGGHVGPELRDVASTYTHWELESLPSGGWGYMHFPLSQRYARTLGHDCLGMTGKFHTSWGDFHSLKNRAALEFECFQMLALGAKCSIGDQLHPRGRLDRATYDLVGGVYAEVEKKEPWCRLAKPVTEIAIVSPEEFVGGRVPLAASGAVRMLQEARHQFDVVDTRADLGRYRLIVLPDEIRPAPAFAAALERYLDGGGSIVASCRSGLRHDLDVFALPAFGVTRKGEAPFSPDFIRVRAPLAAGLPPSELVMYLKGLEVEPAPGAEVLADVVVPYFNRTWEHYFSHRHTPSSGEVRYPGAVRAGQVIYFAHPIFSQYGKNAPRWCRTLVENALQLLLDQPLVKVDGPSTLIATVNEQAAERRWVVHLLHYVPERRGQDFDTIEDVIPLADVTVSLRAPRAVKAVTLVPERRVVPHELRNGRVHWTVPRVTGHQMVAVEFA